MKSFSKTKLYTILSPCSWSHRRWTSVGSPKLKFMPLEIGKGWKLAHKRYVYKTLLQSIESSLLNYSTWTTSYIHTELFLELQVKLACLYTGTIFTWKKKQPIVPPPYNKNVNNIVVQHVELLTYSISVTLVRSTENKISQY